MVDVKLTGITASRLKGDAIGKALATILKTAFYLSGTAYFITQLVG